MAKWNQLTMTVLGDVLEERERQDDRWGEQNHPSFFADTRKRGKWWAKVTADRWKEDNTDRAGGGTLAWDGIALEEVYEALAEDDGPELYAELIQTAAVFANWAECLRRAGHGPEGIEAPPSPSMPLCLGTVDEGGLATCTRHSGHLGIHYDFVRGISWAQVVDPETPGVC